MATKTQLKKNVRLEVQRFAKDLQSAGIDFEKLIVFGSHTKGTSKPWSDIDVCVVSSRFGRNRHSERVLLMQQKTDKTINIEPHPYTQQDLLEKWDPLAHEIQRYGITV